LLFPELYLAAFWFEWLDSWFSVFSGSS